MITSRKNAHIKQLLSLHKRSVRDKASLFLVEGEKEICLAACFVESIYYVYESSAVRDCINRGIPAYKVSQDVLEKVTYRSGSPIAICRQYGTDLTVLRKTSFLLICESIEKPGNLGAMLRTACCVGVDGVIVVDPIVEIFHPNVVRASLGSLCCVPVVQASREQVVRFLKEKRVGVFVAIPHADCSCFSVNYTGNIAILVGNESNGVSADWIESDIATCISIPMEGENDSLNVSTSAAILLYEAFRQRQVQ